ncbi:MAG: glycerol-3-phosphate 1-O-acyltransferase PlsY [Bryobacterales bacterium]|nr:glycerol-3-phosphate 1-O-acyltransferase PlsY [Bryobacterales bacterium]
MLFGLLAVILAYLIGGIPFGYLVVRLRTGDDVRGLGSGNIGATNVWRTTGRLLGLATLLLDVAKGYFAVWLAARLTNADVGWMCAAAGAVVLGHAFPVFLKFQGGKAVASFVGVALYLTPLPLLAVMILFVVTVAVTRYISLGSIIGAGLYWLAVYLIQHPPVEVMVLAVLAGAFIIWRHKGNIQRLRAGNENVFNLKAKGARA